MPYRRLGRSGLKVSVLSFGSWVSFGTQIDEDQAPDCMAAAHDAGVNFFDNAEVYAGGESERIMGKALARSGLAASQLRASPPSSSGDWTRGSNTSDTLNRKYLFQAMDGSLERFGLDFVDLVFCHRADPETPIEETVWAMHDLDQPGQGPLLGHLGVGRR